MDFDDFGPASIVEDSFADSFFGVDKENESQEPVESNSRRSTLLSNFVSQLSRKAAERRMSLKPKNTASPGKSPRRVPRRLRRQPSNESVSSTASVEWGDGSGAYQSRKRKGLDRVPSIAAISSRRISTVSIDDTPAPKKVKVPVKEYRPPTPQKARPKEQELWSNTVPVEQANLGDACVRRQEAIYEMYLHAKSMMTDAKTVLDNYERPMASLGLVSDMERKTLFGSLSTFPEIHKGIADRISQQRDDETGRTECVGPTLVCVLPTLQPLVKFGSELQVARDVYDHKLQTQRAKDFLERCRTCAFSNRRSLWDLLDSQRSSLLKYPLLLRQLIKVTPPDHADIPNLNVSLKVIEDLVGEMDRLTGDVKCRQALSQLQYPSEKRCPVVDASTQLLYSGPLKISIRNVQVEVLLFDRALLVTRKVRQRTGGQPVYHVVYNPLYTFGMRLEDGRLGKDPANSAFRTLRSTSNMEASSTFSVERTCAPGMLYAKERSTLSFTATNNHDAKAWTQAISDAIIASFHPSNPSMHPSRPGGQPVEKKHCRSGSASSIPLLSCKQSETNQIVRNARNRRSVR